MFKFVLLASLVALAAGHEIGFGSFAKHTSQIGPKVIDGENAKLGDAPHQVSLHRTGLLTSQHYCGGSLLTPSTVLTAGHCVTEVPINPGQHIDVLAGLVSQRNPGNALQTRKVMKTIVHPEFPGQVAPNDLAIHILSSPFELNEFVNVIPLPSESDPELAGVATLTGWGSTSTTQIPQMPDTLQKVDLPIVSLEECLKSVEGEGTPLDDTMVCTGPLTGGYGACSGDSGGPLVQDGTLVGVVSWGFVPCGSAGKPSVFTKTQSHLAFINENTV